MSSKTEQQQQDPTVADPSPAKEDGEEKKQEDEVLEDNKVFVGNLSFKTTQEALAQFFESSGKVVEATIIKHGRRSLGYGFVTFETAAEAEKARKEQNRKELEGREINVEVAKSKAAHVNDEKKNDSPEARERARARKKRRRARRAAAKKVQQQLQRQQQQNEEEEENRKEEAEKDGTTQKENVQSNGTSVNTSVIDSESGSEKGDNGEKRPQKKRGSASRRRRARKTAKAKDGPSEPSKTVVFVANLPYSATDEVLLRVFEGFSVESAHVARMKNGRSKGYGFVDLVSEEEQQRALASIQDVELEGRAIYLKVALTEHHLPAP